MDYPVVQDLINKAHNGSGSVMPCDIYRYLVANGIPAERAVVTATITSLIGGITTNPTFPIIMKPNTIGTRSLGDPETIYNAADALAEGTKVTLQQISRIVEAILLHPVARELDTTNGVPEKKNCCQWLVDLVANNKWLAKSVFAPKH